MSITWELWRWFGQLVLGANISAIGGRNLPSLDALPVPIRHANLSKQREPAVAGSAVVVKMPRTFKTGLRDSLFKGVEWRSRRRDQELFLLRAE